jgi:hypothetical protein
MSATDEQYRTTAEQEALKEKLNRLRTRLRSIHIHNELRPIMFALLDILDAEL